MSNLSRRSFLGGSSLALSAVAFSRIWDNLIQTASAVETLSVGYGPLVPAIDEATGLQLISLPKGFHYRSYGWTSEKFDLDGQTGQFTTPDQHDGMGVVATNSNEYVLCRNHEVRSDKGSFAPAEITYDPKAGGGCVNLVFDRGRGEFVKTTPTLGGTVKNCAGGVTPWGSWLSCEETVLGPGDKHDGEKVAYEREHGYIFEVPAFGKATGEPLKAMGRFVHEAVAVDPATKIVYETEDADTAGFYRFISNRPGKLELGGRLEMLKVAKRGDLRKGLKMGDRFDVTWVPIEDVDRAHSPGTSDELGVFKQGKEQGGATFARLEGCWYDGGRVYLLSTSGGEAEKGQVFAYDPREETIELLFESPSADVIDKPDNITVSPRSGGLLLCEDGDHIPQRLHGLTTAGQLFPFAANNVNLDGLPFDFKGDFRGEEWAGATFSPDGEWLFVNIQDPGFTLAITGPWDEGPLGNLHGS